MRHVIKDWRLEKHVRKLVFLSILLLLVGQANARPDGIGDVANDGCVCHGGSDDTVNISFVGLPDVYNSSEEYQITLVIESSVEENDVKGGFRILISEGELSGELQEIEEGYTHSSQTNKQRSWNFSWKAPEKDDKLANFVVHANTVNGNGETNGDEWNSRSFSIPGSGYEGEITTPDVGKTEISNAQTIAALIGLSVLIGLAIMVAKD